MRLSAIRIATAGLALICLVLPASAQAPADTRPATTTFLGDTGLWFVPTAEILPAGGWSFSGYRANFDREQGFTDITHIALTAAGGLGNRAEIFGSFRVDTRIARRVRPLFRADRPRAGGLVNEYPFVREGWTGDSVGDLLVGAKINLLSEHRQQPVALAVRGSLKLPTGDEDTGAGTGKLDGAVDLIASKAIGDALELSGFVGGVFRGDPDSPAVALSNGLRWGVGTGLPLRSRLRVFAEGHGEMAFDDIVRLTSSFAAVDGSTAPSVTELRSPFDVTVGVTMRFDNGAFFGVGMNWAVRHDSRSDLLPGTPDKSRDTLGIQARLGFHPGVRVYVPPPPPPPPPPPAPDNRPPTVTARCEPCSVQVGQSARLTADAQDPDGDPLTYQWRAPSGTLATPAQQATQWTAGNDPGTVPVTATVSDGRGGTASDTVTMTVTAAPRVDVTFEDVHFDFDRYSLRPAALRILDEVVSAMRRDSALRIEIEGHTCNIGTAEYNLALGDRRAAAVRAYLTQQGIAADRLSTVSYGEERPRHDNRREETRRLNRRAALVVRMQ